MKELLLLLLVSSFCSINGISQQTNYVRPAALGVSFTLTDYTTAQRIRSSSLSSVLSSKQTADFNEMSPGLGLTYFKGLTNNIDFAGTLLGTFTTFTVNNTTATDAFLLEGDASVNIKLFSDKYFFTPYVSAGVGLSSYNKKMGAFIPLGGGLKLNVFDEAAIFISSQYRVPVTTETNTYHFVHGVGIAGVIGKRKEATQPTLPAQ